MQRWLTLGSLFSCFPSALRFVEPPRGLVRYMCEHTATPDREPRISIASLHSLVSGARPGSCLPLLVQVRPKQSVSYCRRREAAVSCSTSRPWGKKPLCGSLGHRCLLLSGRFTFAARCFRHCRPPMAAPGLVSQNPRETDYHCGFIFETAVIADMGSAEIGERRERL